MAAKRGAAKVATTAALLATAAQSTLGEEASGEARQDTRSFLDDARVVFTANGVAQAPEGLRLRLSQSGEVAGAASELSTQPASSWIQVPALRAGPMTAQQRQALPREAVQFAVQVVTDQVQRMNRSALRSSASPPQSGGQLGDSTGSCAWPFETFLAVGQSISAEDQQDMLNLGLDALTDTGTIGDLEGIVERTLSRMETSMRLGGTASITAPEDETPAAEDQAEAGPVPEDLSGSVAREAMEQLVQDELANFQRQIPILSTENLEGLGRGLQELRPNNQNAAQGGDAPAAGPPDGAWAAAAASGGSRPDGEGQRTMSGVAPLEQEGESRSRGAGRASGGGLPGGNPQNVKRSRVKKFLKVLLAVTVAVAVVVCGAVLIANAGPAAAAAAAASPEVVASGGAATVAGFKLMFKMLFTGTRARTASI